MAVVVVVDGCNVPNFQILVFIPVVSSVAYRERRKIDQGGNPRSVSIQNGSSLYIIVVVVATGWRWYVQTAVTRTNRTTERPLLHYFMMIIYKCGVVWIVTPASIIGDQTIQRRILVLLVEYPTNHYGIWSTNAIDAVWRLRPDSTTQQQQEQHNNTKTTTTRSFDSIGQ